MLAWGIVSVTQIPYEESRILLMKTVMRYSLVLSLFMVLVPFNLNRVAKVCSWSLKFEDHFDAATLNTIKWSTTYPSGNGGEQQYYGPKAFSITNSKVSIIATKTPANGYAYTSGIIISRGHFAQQYGRFEVRAKLPAGQGYWPAIWLLPATPKFPLEIDVMEMLGKNSKVMYMSNHYRDSSGVVRSLTKPTTINVDYSTGFHTFEVIWNSTSITWYVDGVQQLKTTQYIPKVPMYFLINLAVGGKWPGNPDSTTKFPGVMQIDYARAYTQVCK
jgi:beta-glucanase (GH16 family)